MKTILTLCHEPSKYKELRGYLSAFQRCGISLVTPEEGIPVNADVAELVERCPERPFLILQPEAALPLLPQNLTEIDIPTACFQIDTYAYTSRRIRWSMLFDYVFLSHPGFDGYFRKAGHSRPVMSFHAAARELFEGPEEERIFEVGWVGSINVPIYKTRRRILGSLARRFRMNDWMAPHCPDELASVYRQSKVVVNIGRDDYPQDANMRVFEAMAAGALLLTSLPSELASIGFEEGVHFVGYRDESEIVELVAQYLGDEPARWRIAEAGREKVMREHTYDCRVEALLQALERDAGRLFAPGRRWSEERVHLVYLDYFAAHNRLDCAYGELGQIAQRSLRKTLVGASLIARAWARQYHGRVMARVLRQP